MQITVTVLHGGETLSAHGGHRGAFNFSMKLLIENVTAGIQHRKNAKPEMLQY